MLECLNKRPEGRVQSRGGVDMERPVMLAHTRKSRYFAKPGVGRTSRPLFL
jgi:hypothetical protein